MLYNVYRVFYQHSQLGVHNVFFMKESVYILYKITAITSLGRIVHVYILLLMIEVTSDDIEYVIVKASQAFCSRRSLRWYLQHWFCWMYSS